MLEGKFPSWNATEYVRGLTESLLRTLVTDLQGTQLSLDEGISATALALRSVQERSSKVLLIGNGGSAAIASHMQCDLCKAAEIRALVFNEAPFLTALSNDEGYANAFAQSVKLWAEAGDLLVAISSSGQSENILHAVSRARERGAKVVTLSGFSIDNPLRRLGDVNFYAPSREYGYVELIHSILGHLLTDFVSGWAAETQE